MIYNFGNMAISSFRVETENELKSILSENDNSFSVSDSESGTKFKILEVRLGYKRHIIYCGLIYGGYTPFEPMIIKHPCKNYIWLAMDSAVYIVSFDKLIVVKEIPVPLYWDMIVGIKYPIIVIHEMGALALDNNGEKLWILEGDDKLNHFNIEKDQITLVFDDGNTKKHDI